jgi:predicted permease
MWLDEFLRRLGFVARYKRFDREMQEEVEFHLAMKERDLVNRGMSPEQARSAAHRKFGNDRRLAERSHEAWGWSWVETLLQDTRYALRQLRKNPGFTIVAVATLALGIGANTAIFSAANAISLRLLPVAEPQRLVALETTFSTGMMTGRNRSSFTQLAFDAFRRRHDVFSELVGYVPLAWGAVAVRAGADPELVHGDMVSGNFFSALGVPIVLGRQFTLKDETGHSQIAVLSYNYWKVRFNEDPSAIGRTIFIKTVPFTIVGVATKGFAGIEFDVPTDLWIPFQSDTRLKPWGRAEQSRWGMYNSPTWWFLMMMGRLAPGVTADQASVRLDAEFQRIAYESIPAPGPKDERPHVRFASTRGIPGLRDTYGKPLSVLLAMVGLVLLIACANVAMLLIARNSTRQREFAVRLAIGGSRERLLRQLLTESSILVLAGTTLGWFLATSSTHVLAAWAGISFDLAPDQNVLFFTVGVAVAAATVFALVPLRAAARAPVVTNLKFAGPQATQSHSGMRSGQVVVALQMSLCLALLVASGLLVRCLRNLQSVDLGLDASRLLVFGINPLKLAHSDADTIAFYRSLLDRLRTLSGVEAATLLEERIGKGESNNTMAIVDGKNPRNQPSLMRWNITGPDFLRTLGIRLVLGRDFTDADSQSSPRVAIINQTFASRYLPGQPPLGHRIGLSRKESDQYTIIGVAADSKYTGVREQSVPTAYFPYTQVAGIGTMNFELRSGVPPSLLLPAVRRVVRQLAPDSPLVNPVSQKEQFEDSYSQERLFAHVAELFGALAALLIAAGLYGTASYRVSRRTEEIGVRMALGARRTQVLWMILREGLALSAVGIGLGLPLAIGAARIVRSTLYGLGPGDPLSFAAAFAGIVIVALGATLLPARRAASLEPLTALRYE